MPKFEETQRICSNFRIILFILFVVFLTLTIFLNVDFIVGTIMCLVFLIIFYILKLNLTVYDDRIEYKLFPFHKSNRVIMLNSIVKIDTIRPSKLGIFGFKIKNTPSGTFYYFGGNTIMRIRTIDGKVLLIGTRKIEKMEHALK
ncbi:hypothetical protein EDC18_103336 [Natranaerovirga pectinivora]|uniref:PH (Pleckstrin Homology) domain-containing protein n=1 Tax=Natranaerovirga pectinivora TaxID=682400 RepID=A0A4R3MLT2_9FIRM|nr:hypothetical protein [Natranaerovirga pectinivora]TCT15628.1 hypothetical protein EDC18_103336 [Natranaerovirga pectinivora]